MNNDSEDTIDEGYDEDVESEDSGQIEEYDITATPNDFNVLTIFNFIESGAIRVPNFQRNYVWDLTKASKLIESLVLGLPVPQIFLYEADKNTYDVIDGQQRLMSIFYFMKMRFPRMQERARLRIIYDEHNNEVPESFLYDDQYFTTFNLKLPPRSDDTPNKFNGLNYETLGEYKRQFDLRPIRNVIVKQNKPEGDKSSMYEMFNRLNSGGMNLKPQEIRASLYHSEFYEKLSDLNRIDEWRRLLNKPSPTLHMEDIQVLLRAVALLDNGDMYAPSMTQFLNRYSEQAKANDSDKNMFLVDLFEAFLITTRSLPGDVFIRNNRFNVMLFEAVFIAACRESWRTRDINVHPVSREDILALENDDDFKRATMEGTTKSINVKSRIERAEKLIAGD